MDIQLFNTRNHDFYIKLSGEMDASGCNDISSDLEAIIYEKAQQHITLDIEEVSFLDSSGVGIIVFLFKRLKAVGGSLEIKNVAGQPRKLFELLHVGSVISVEYK